jgi:transposase InsO family protein
LNPGNTCRSATPNAWPRPARSPRSVPAATPSTTRWPRPGLYKTELVRRRGPWKGIDDVEYATLEWVDWFNHRRLLEPIGYVPPAEFEATFLGKEDPSDPVRLKHPSLR